MRFLIGVFLLFYATYLLCQDIGETHPILRQTIHFRSAKTIKIYLDMQENFERFYVQSGAITENGDIVKEGWLAKIANSKMTILEAITIAQISMLDHGGARKNCMIAFDNHQRVIQALFKDFPGVYSFLYNDPHHKSKI